jgi:hypothetical protein
VNPIYIADLSKTMIPQMKRRPSSLPQHTNFISHISRKPDVYPYCASAGLSTVVRGTIDKDALALVLAKA